MANDAPENLCIMPFIHLGSKPDGVARICCMAPDLEIKEGEDVLSFETSSIDKAWNSSYLKAVRKRMLSGEKLPECESCWKQEANGPHSKRLRENRKYLKRHLSKIEEAKSNDGSLKSSPVYFDLRLGNRCNLKCRTCNPIFSHLWKAELEENGVENLKGYALSDNQYMLKRSQQMSAWYRDQFFGNLSDVIDNLEEVYVSGGEPTLISELNNFMQVCAERRRASEIDMRLNSNILVVPSEFLENLLKFKKVQFGASIDAFGERNSWLRHPSKWTAIEKNLLRLAEMSKNHKNFNLSVNITISSYNAFYVDELILWIKDKCPHVDFIFDFVSKPWSMSLKTFPKSLVEPAIEKIRKISFSELNKMEVMYLGQLEKALLASGSEESGDLRNELIHQTKTTDQWRNEKFENVFPELWEAWKVKRRPEHASL